MEQENTLLKKNTPSIAIIIETKSSQLALSYSLSIQNLLQDNTINATIYFDKESLKSSLKKANTENALLCCIINDTQIANKTIIIKEMHHDKRQTEINYNQILKYIQQYQHYEK